MLKDEGYLTFTLPATVGQHIASKMIVCITWVIATVVLTGVSIFVVTYSKDIDYARDISYSVQKLTQLGAWHNCSNSDSNRYANTYVCMLKHRTALY